MIAGDHQQVYEMIEPDHRVISRELALPVISPVNIVNSF